MRFLKIFVRQALLAALTLLPLPALAEVAARFDPATGSVVVTGLSEVTRNKVLTAPDMLRLQVAALDTTRGMPLSLKRRDDALVIVPRFALKPGTDYVLNIGMDRFDIRFPQPKATPPTLAGFAPSQAVIPANTLRFYLQFSEPMARGHLRKAVRLERNDGSRIASPFLNLVAELWDASQTRATLLLDPGRIKQGVGPNTQGGAPLTPGQSYRLVVSGQMTSAKGAPLGADIVMTFRVGPPERRAIDPGSWQVLAPAPRSHAPLTVAFDRIMDTGAVRQLLTLEDPQGAPVRGQITTDGGGWSLTPNRPWRPGTYRLVVAPDLEDISGNTPGVPFDAGAGTIGTAKEPVILTIHIAG